MTLPRLSEDVGHYFPIFLSYGLRFSLVLPRSITSQVKLSQTPQMKLFKKFLNINAKFVNADRISIRYAENRDREKVRASRTGKWFLLAGNADPWMRIYPKLLRSLFLAG